METLVFVLFVAVISLSVALVKKGNKKVEESVSEMTPEELAAGMSREKKEELIRQFQGKTLSLAYGKHVKASITDLNIDYVDVMGIRYGSFEEALEKSTVIPEDDRWDMRIALAELHEVRRELIAAERYVRHEETEFDGEVFFYKEGVMSITTTKGPHANKPARIAAEIVKNNSGKMGIATIFVASSDIANAATVYPFDMTTQDGQDKFDALVRNKSDKYAAEIEELDIIAKHLSKYNTIVKQDRIRSTSDGGYVIMPPTEAQAQEVAQYNPTPTVANPIFGNKK